VNCTKKKVETREEVNPIISLNSGFHWNLTTEDIFWFVTNASRLRMERFTEKFTIRVTDSGLLIMDQEGQCLSFSAGEALMLLDILTNEEAELKAMAENASPLPVTIPI
jgi:hypothetical protein